MFKHNLFHFYENQQFEVQEVLNSNFKPKTLNFSNLLRKHLSLKKSTNKVL